MPFVDRPDRIDVELPGLDRVDDVGPEHQVLDVLVGDDDALGPGQALGLADLEESLDLLVDSADGLDLAFLIERAGDGDVLAEGQAREAREDGVDLGRGGAVAVDAAVGLLEGERRGQVNGRFAAYFPRRYPPRMRTPLLWVGPLRSASRSMLMTPARPMAVRAVMRAGLPNMNWPMS